MVGRHVDGPAVDPDSAPHVHVRSEELTRRPSLGVARELEARGRASPPILPVTVRVAIPVEIEASTRPELDEVEAASVGDGQERGEKAPAALHLVRLDGLLGHEACKPVLVRLQHPAELGPRMLHHPRELEVVHAAEEAKRRLPLGLVIADERLDDGFVRQRARERRVELRAALLEVVRHSPKDLCGGLRQGFSPA
jgi:hypothetical protein